VGKQLSSPLASASFTLRLFLHPEMEVISYSENMTQNKPGRIFEVTLWLKNRRFARDDDDDG
jgi:hypothetical protein